VTNRVRTASRQRIWPTSPAGIFNSAVTRKKRNTMSSCMIQPNRTGTRWILPRMPTSGDTTGIGLRSTTIGLLSRARPLPFDRAVTDCKRKTVRERPRRLCRIGETMSVPCWDEMHQKPGLPGQAPYIFLRQISPDRRCPLCVFSPVLVPGSLFPGPSPSSGLPGTTA